MSNEVAMGRGQFSYVELGEMTPELYREQYRYHEFVIFFEEVNDFAESKMVAFGVQINEDGAGGSIADPHEVALFLWGEIDPDIYSFRVMIVGNGKWEMIGREQLSKFVEGRGEPE